MSEYKTIFGKAVKALASDPTDAGAEGQVWYNSTSGTFKSVVGTPAWISGGNLPTALSATSGTGDTNAALNFGGLNPTPANVDTTYAYDGSTWASPGATLSLARRSLGGAGTQTAAVAFGGVAVPGITAVTDNYNGTVWTASGSLSTARRDIGGAGTQIAAIAFGGEVPGSPSFSAAVEEYNGTAWTSGGSLPAATKNPGSAGTLTAGLAFGGVITGPAKTNVTSEYNGTSWSPGGNLNTTRSELGGSGIQTAAAAFGGEAAPGASSATESYDGSSWTTASASLATARYGGGGAGDSNISALYFGGFGTARSAATEELSYTIYAPIASTWASGGNLPAPISANQGAGTQTAALSISGQPTAPGTAATTATNEYDGSAWTAGGSLAAGAASYGGASATKGSQTASLFWGGYNPTPPPAGFRTTVSSYDGSSWTAQSPFPGFSTTGYASGAGTENAALGMGGYLVTNTYESDASYNWTAGGALPQARYATAAGGPQTAAISAGGFGGSPVVIQNNADTYDGSSWTAISVTPISYAQKNGCFGTDSSDFVVAGGESNRADTIAWDGISWSTTTSLSTGRQGGSGAGASGSIGLLSGGQNPSFTNVTEEFTGEIPQLNFQTLTSS